MKIEHLCDKLSPRFPDIEQVDESVARFERKAGSRPFAVCYVDVSTRLPDSTEALNAYQDRVVGRHYFEGSKSLQWSNYLYFLVDSLPSQEAKAIVERDRKYARKFIVTESELDTALSPPSFQVSDAAVKTDILATWTATLAAANLDRAILNDESLPKRLDLIEAAFAQRAVAPPSASPTPRQAWQPFLREIDLKLFRKHPVTRKFHLGLVTLLCGPNGTGKTSLLEAIELTYCGRTKRNPDSADAYSFSATFADGTNEVANNRRAQSLFRERHLAWYGQSEQRTNNLFQTFARFNFLNTDAAVGLAAAKDDFEEDLSKLLVGPAASKTWREIERTAEKLDEKIKDLETLRNQVDLDLASHKRQIAASSDLKRESGAVLKKLDELLSRLQWVRDAGDPALSVGTVVESLAELDTLIKQAIRCEWAGAPVTLAKLRGFANDGPSRIANGTRLAKEIKDAQTSERRVNHELAEIQNKNALLDELSKLVQAGLPERIAELERLQSLITTHQWAVAAFDQEFHPFLTLAATLSVKAFAASATQAEVRATQHLNDARKRYAEFSALRDESVSLGQRLREVAAQLIDKASEPDKCPLCQTRFQPGELASHMRAGVDQQLEDQAATLLSKIREQERTLANAVSNRLAAECADGACLRLGQSSSITVSQLMLQVEERQSDYADLVQKRSRIFQEIAQLQGSGLSGDRYREIIAGLLISDEPVTLERVKEESGKLEERKRRMISERDELTRTIQDSMLVVEATLSVSGDPAIIDSALAGLKEQLVATNSLLTNLRPFNVRFPWSDDHLLSELAVPIAMARQLAGDFQVTSSKEQNAIKVLAEASYRKDQLEKQLAGLVPRIERFTEARNVLTKIQNQHSLNSAMEDALRQNRAAIEAIFARIHSPAEFSGLGSSLTTLVRKNNAETASLQQISTGQRAAFALSLFLAQNAQLRSAPPMILIDDPIAHVDDLNCLSFLDYLREVVVAGDRQVVFATANDKLAMLFERKFDFLGTEDFRRYDLRR